MMTLIIIIPFFYFQAKAVIYIEMLQRSTSGGVRYGGEQT